MFGIAWPDPGVTPVPPLGFLEHATSPTLDGPRTRWERSGSVLEMRADRGETVMWAPHVVRHRGVDHLFVATGGPDPTRWGITLATSTGLDDWTRVGAGPLFRDGFQARDPMVLHLSAEGLWVLYYTATEHHEGGRHVVAYRTSADLLHWGERRIAYRDAHEGTDFGPTESPFVVRRGRRFYLFIGPRPYDRPTPDRPNFRHPGYVGTEVFASDDWRRWTDAGRVGRVAAHAAELVEDAGGSWFISSAGIARGGLDLAPFRWADP
jgi:beta-fructofuranosidase